MKSAGDLLAPSEQGGRSSVGWPWVSRGGTDATSHRSRGRPATHEGRGAGGGGAAQGGVRGGPSSGGHQSPAPKPRNRGQGQARSDETSPRLLLGHGLRPEP